LQCEVPNTADNMAKITVQKTQIMVIKQNEDDYISLTDTSESDAESDSRHLYALRLAKFNTRRCKISDGSRLNIQNISV